MCVCARVALVILAQRCLHCYRRRQLLDLPRYNTKEKLKFKLLQAIQQTQGFSLV